MLLPHRETLERLDISYPRHPNVEPEQVLDVSDFPKLEHLGLSRRQMGKDIVFSAADASLLLAPVLKTFEWDFSVVDSQGVEHWYPFGEKQETWLREFLRMAVKRKAALKSVVLVFDKDRWKLASRKGNEAMFKRLDSLKEEFQPHGVVVTYPETLG